MYVPKHFAQTDEQQLFDVIEQNPFATLISVVDDAPYATHLPFTLDRDAREVLDGGLAHETHPGPPAVEQTIPVHVEGHPLGEQITLLARMQRPQVRGEQLAGSRGTLHHRPARLAP